MDDKKKKIIDWFVRIILIIIIIFLLLHNCELMKERNNYSDNVPSGNIDIIEITCDKDNVCQDDKKEDNNKKITPAIKEEENKTPLEEEKGLIVYDKDIKWQGDVKARIFTNSMYKKDIIAPETFNTYQFVVKNSTDYNLTYQINFVEDNPYHINMQYKLKKNNTYLIDHYVSANELKLSSMPLDMNNSDTYYLEWKWISSDNDTEIGKTPNANYGLKIEIKAESVDEVYESVEENS